MASSMKRQISSENNRLLCGSCPDTECQAKLYFPSYDKSVECTSCGQRHERGNLKNVAEVTNPEVALHNLLFNILQGNVKVKKGVDNDKVLGLSNYVCKLISPILTIYGLDKVSGKAKLLSEMGKGEIFDVSVLGDRAFLIDEEHMDVTGYGRDKSGSVSYLSETLNDIAAFNDNATHLVPLHADGDGHCLVHAISRALVGRELFWHALRANLKKHMVENLSSYKALFQDFIDKDEWSLIVDECDPYYLPPEDEALGLRNIHIFGLANVLHRPIILLDSKSGMNSKGDYSGVFLPGLTDPEKCRGKDRSLNKPLCIAWSSPGRNHYIPLVGVKGKDPPRLPSYMVQKAWGMPTDFIKQYIEFDKLYRCVVGGDKCLTDRYLLQLVNTMEEVFKDSYEVNPNLVADVHQYIYKASGIVGVHTDEVIERTQRAASEKLLYRCLQCEALVEYHLSPEQFQHGGTLYNLAVSIHKELDPTKLYSFPANGAVCTYNAEQDCLEPDMQRSHPKTCAFCSGSSLRQVRADGSIEYKDGDRTATPCSSTKCPCGFKHFYNGKEYDNLPEIIPISLMWGGKTIAEEIPWFQFESDPTQNSNVYQVAQQVVQKHFPGEFGSEILVQRVVDTILNQTARAAKEKEGENKDQPIFDSSVDNPWTADTASKIILTGPKKKTIHKEELVKSEKEKQVRKNIQTNAPKVQTRKAMDTKDKPAPMDTSVHQPVVSIQSVSQTSIQPVASTSSESQANAKKIRLATSDGQQAMLTLSEDVTYSQLQQLIKDAVNIPAARQKIRVGFPPKLLGPCQKGEEQEVVKLAHGDKITLEVLPEAPSSLPGLDKVQPSPCSSHAPHHTRPVGPWSTFEEETQSTSAESLLQALKSAPHSGDNLDASIASLRILSAVAGKDLWTYVQTMPHLFSVGGLFYNQMKRDLGLVDGKHCQLPVLPGKIFRYSATDDRLELCLEPYGHFPVEPNIEHKVNQSGIQGEQGDGKEEVKFGSSGAIHHGQERRAFSGAGHSMLATDIRMPGDLECADHRSHARGFKDLCSPGTHPGSIAEEPDTMQTDDQVGGKAQYQKLGPGYSVLDQSAVNRDNNNIEMFRALAESIEKTLSQEMEEDGSASEEESAEQNNLVSMETNEPSASATQQPELSVSSPITCSFEKIRTDRQMGVISTSAAGMSETAPTNLETVIVSSADQSVVSSQLPRDVIAVSKSESSSQQPSDVIGQCVVTSNDAVMREVDESIASDVAREGEIDDASIRDDQMKEGGSG